MNSENPKSARPHGETEPVGVGATWFRVTLVAAALGAWALAFWVMNHASTQPSILGRYSRDYFNIVLVVVGAAVGLSSMLVGPVYRRLERVKYQLVLMVVSMALGLVLIEVAVRVLDPLGISHYAELEAYGLDKVPDDDLIYKHQNNIRKTYFGFEESFNEIGLRDRAIGAKADKEYRVLVLGDSVTYGVGVAVEDTYSRKLEKQLAERLQRAVRTINSGVASYNTVQEATFCFKHWDLIQPDLVVLLYVDNDIAVARSGDVRIMGGSLGGRSPAEKIQMIASRSWLFRLVVHSVRRAQGGLPVIDRQSRGWIESMEALRDIHKHCQSHGARFVTFMWRNHYGDLSEALWQDISAMGEGEGFAACDVLAWFEGKDLRSLTNSAVDVHPNAEGHQILADGMEQFLLDAGFFPGEEASSEAVDEAGSGGG